MADSVLFESVARAIEHSTSLNELQSRGMVRRLLSQAGLNAADVTAAQLTVVGRKLLRDALQRNGVTDVDPVISKWLDACTRTPSTRPADRPVSNTVEEVFARMGLKR